MCIGNYAYNLLGGYVMQTYKIPHIISRTVTNYDDNNVTIIT